MPVEEAIAEIETEPTVAAATAAGRNVAKHDFRSPATLAKNDQRKLRVHHEEFARALAARLSIYLRMELDLQVSKLDTMTYGRFVESMTHVSNLTLFKVAPMQGMGILDLAPRLSLAIVDRLMGGAGKVGEEERDLSEIEQALLDQAANVVLSEWCNQWPELREQPAQILGHEQQGRFLQTAPPRTVMLVLGLEAKLGDCVGPIQLVVPFDELEPMTHALRAKSGEAEPPATDPRTQVEALRARWTPQLESIPVRIKANFPGLDVTARDLTKMSVGQVIKLDANSPEQIRLIVANKPKYVGQLGAQGAHRAIRLTRPLDS